MLQCRLYGYALEAHWVGLKAPWVALEAPCSGGPMGMHWRPCAWVCTGGLLQHWRPYGYGLEAE